jgi:hypothetical protein
MEKEKEYIKYPKRTRRSVGFVDLLTLLFIGLKLTGDIDWSWWCVLLPMLILISLFILRNTLIWGHNKLVDLISKVEQEELEQSKQQTDEGSRIDAQL